MAKKIIPALILIIMVCIYFISGLENYLTLSFLKNSRESLKQIYTENPAAFISLYCAIYLFIVSLNIPGAIILGLAAGFFFGLLAGAIIVSFISAISATAACFLSRYILRDFIQKKFPDKIDKINKGIESEGGYYLFSLRLIPVMPFFLINMGMGLTKMPLWKFYFISQIGMLPGTIVFINAGKELGKIENISGILSPGLMGSFILIGALPLILKKIHTYYKRNYAKKSAAESAYR